MKKNIPSRYFKFKAGYVGSEGDRSWRGFFHVLTTSHVLTPLYGTILNPMLQVPSENAHAFRG